MWVFELSNTNSNLSSIQNRRSNKIKLPQATITKCHFVHINLQFWISNYLLRCVSLVHDFYFFWEWIIDDFELIKTRIQSDVKGNQRLTASLIVAPQLRPNLFCSAHVEILGRLSEDLFYAKRLRQHRVETSALLAACYANWIHVDVLTAKRRIFSL